MFAGRSLLIATKHEKEKVIAPILEKALGVNCYVSSNFDTDQLGTFTGEVERKDDPYTTALNKCRIAMDIENCDLAVASEGSFGAHPSIFFAPADDELLILVDKKNNLEISVRELSTETNFSGREILSAAELRAFAEASQFPSHALIMRRSKDDFSNIHKGITNWTTLLETFQSMLDSFGSVFIETDMRAMYNPTRLKIIESAAIKLANKINTCCPNCATPGFGITGAKKGLPCGNCNFPTNSTISYLYTCDKCGWSKEENYPNGKRHEDPMFCDFCNP